MMSPRNREIKSVVPSWILLAGYLPTSEHKSKSDGHWVCAHPGKKQKFFAMLSAFRISNIAGCTYRNAGSLEGALSWSVGVPKLGSLCRCLAKDGVLQVRATLFDLRSVNFATKEVFIFASSRLLISRTTIQHLQVHIDGRQIMRFLDILLSYSAPGVCSIVLHHSH